MDGERDLTKILSTLRVVRRPGRFAYVSLPRLPDAMPPIAAQVDEAEGTTVVVAVEEATRRGWRISLEVAWLTLEVHSALDSVGLTAAVAAALADSDIPCNMIAGTYHDHILVPVADAARAIRALHGLRDATSWPLPRAPR